MATQYFMPIFLGAAGEPYETLRYAVDSTSFGEWYALMAHSYLGTEFMNAVEHALSPEGDYWKSRLVWAGDHADEEPSSSSSHETLFYRAICGDYPKDYPYGLHSEPMDDYRYIVNHTKGLYIDKEAVKPGPDGRRLHPLPLLTAEGNCRGPSDYSGNSLEAVGSWARDVISVKCKKPSIYEGVDPLDHDNVEGEEYKLVAYDFCKN
jgi:hypothetical protein